MNWMRSSNSSKDTRTVLMLGLGDSGKSTILYWPILKQRVTYVPTIGFNVETINSSSGTKITIWDVGDQEQMRPLWAHYYPFCQGFIVVVDGSNIDTLQISREIFRPIAAHNDMRGVPLLLLVNKSDLPSFIGLSAVVNALGMDRVVDRLWHVHACSAETGEGIMEALDELVRMMKYFRRT